MRSMWIICLRSAADRDVYKRQLVTQSDADPLKQIQNAENWITKDAQVLAGIWCDRDATRPVLDMCMELSLIHIYCRSAQ